MSRSTSSASNERSPLLPTTTSARSRVGAPPPSSSSSSSPPQQHHQNHHHHSNDDARLNSSTTTLSSPSPPPPIQQQQQQFTDDDIAIEGMVMVLLVELDQRGYAVPSGLQVTSLLELDAAAAAGKSRKSSTRERAAGSGAGAEDDDEEDDGDDGDDDGMITKEELEQEQAIFRKAVLDDVERHRKVFDEYLPRLRSSSSSSAPGRESGGGATGLNASARGPENGQPSVVGYGATTGAVAVNRYSPSRSSPLSKPDPDDEESKIGSSDASGQLYQVDDDLITSPSALLLCALLSLLISLQAAPTSQVQETDRGVDGELRMFKARRELGERLYAVVGGLLDSYLLSGDHRRQENEGDQGALGDDEGEDALVTLLFHDFALYYDTTDRATCAMDLLLNLSSYPLVEAEDLVSHPVVLATTEYVWRNGLLPPPKRGENTALTWTESFVRLDRFSIPRILHSQAYIASTLHAAITVYILMFSSYAHFDALNPLAPDAILEPGIPERSRPRKTWSVWTELVWWLWVAGVFGWAGEVLRAWHHRGPHPNLPLSPSTLLPLIHHALVLASLALRLSLLMFKRKPGFILASSLSILAWSIPFLAASRVLPQNLPAFGAPTHQRWEKIRDGRKRRELGYRPPPKSVPVSHRALRSLEAHLGGLVQFGSYFGVFGILLLWSLSGELDYPGLIMWPLSVREYVLDQVTFSSVDAMAARGGGGGTGRGTVSPLEARTTLAFTLILGLVLAYFSGGRPSVSGKPPPSHHFYTQPLLATTASSQGGQGASSNGSSNNGINKGLDDLDGWDRYGREVAFRARRERLAINRYYTFAPAQRHRRCRELESVQSAFSTPPLTAPLNLAIPLVGAVAIVCRWLGRDDKAKVAQERGRVWAWRVGIAPLGVWAVLAKGVRTLRRRE